MRNLQLPGRSPVLAPNGMVSTSQPLSTAAGLHVLREGGNALDAALAAVAVQCVVEPASTGIGGDCFCLYAPAGADEVIAFNGSAGPTHQQLNRDHGNMPLDQLLEPAIGYAKDGFPVGQRSAFDFAGCL